MQLTQQTNTNSSQIGGPTYQGGNLISLGQTAQLLPIWIQEVKFNQCFYKFNIVMKYCTFVPCHDQSHLDGVKTGFLWHSLPSTMLDYTLFLLFIIKCIFKSNDMFSLKTELLFDPILCKKL